MRCDNLKFLKQHKFFPLFLKDITEGVSSVEGDLLSRSCKEHVPWCPQFYEWQSLVLRLQWPGEAKTDTETRLLVSRGDSSQLSGMWIFQKCIHRCVCDNGWCAESVCTQISGCPAMIFLTTGPPGKSWGPPGMFFLCSWSHCERRYLESFAGFCNLSLMFTSRPVLHRQELKGREK